MVFTFCVYMYNALFFNCNDFDLIVCCAIYVPTRVSSNYNTMLKDHMWL